MAMAITEKVIQQVGAVDSGSEMNKRYGDSWNKAVDAGRLWADEYITEKLRHELGSSIAWEILEKNLASQIPLVGVFHDLNFVTNREHYSPPNYRFLQVWQASPPPLPLPGGPGI